MALTFAEDFSSTTTLDSELIGKSTSGLYWNRGVHPILTVDNLVSLLPITTISFGEYDETYTYSEFNDSKSKSDIVSYGDDIYQSLQGDNLGKALTDADYWLKTNIESLRIKAFIWTVEDNANAALSINRKLIENQYIYNVGEDYRTVTGYHGWAFEPKGSDYVTIRLNEIAIQAEGTDDVSLYVINQGRLIDTLTLTCNDGVLDFDRKDYEFNGKGAFYFIIDAGDGLQVKGEAYNNALKYSGFTCYPVSGDTLLSSDYDQNWYGNGLNFNVTAYLDSSKYIENNKIDLASMYRAQMEMNFVEMWTLNTNSRDNRVEDILSENALGLLATEKLDGKLNTIAKKYNITLDEHRDIINKTFDRFLQTKPKFRVKKKTV